MAEFKFDIFQGTSEDLSTSLTRFDQAVRRVRAINLDTSEPIAAQRLHDAIEELLTDFPGVLIHEGITDLPLQRVRGQLLGPTKAIIDLIYRRTEVDFGPIPGPTSAVIARFRSTYEPTEVFRKSVDDMGNPVFDPITGLPSGEELVNMSPALTTSQNDRPEPWIFRRPAMQIAVPFQLLQNPLSIASPFLGSINANALQLKGTTFQFRPLSVRFDAIEVDWRIVEGVLGPFTVFDVDYLFTHIKGQFFQQVAFFDEVSGNWQVDDFHLAHEPKTWPTPFPNIPGPGGP